MDEKSAQQFLDELLPSLEALETRSVAILQFLKDKGMATDEELAPYFEQAGNASNVRWRAARLRMNHLLAAAAKPPEQGAKKQGSKTDTTPPRLEGEPERSEGDPSRAEAVMHEKGADGGSTPATEEKNTEAARHNPDEAKSQPGKPARANEGVTEPNKESAKPDKKGRDAA